MASRRSLVSRQNRDASSPAVQRPRGNRDTDLGQTPRSRQPAALPPYEPPTCPLDEKAKLALTNVTMNLDLKKYEKHLNAAVKNLTDFAGESNDHLWAGQEKVRRMAQKREALQDDSEKTEAEEKAEKMARDMEKKVEKLTAQSEKALRDLIDYKQELAQQGEMLEHICNEAAASSTASTAASSSAAASGSRAARRGRRPDQLSDDDDEDGAFEPPPENEENEDAEMSGMEPQAATLSPTELLRKAKEEYQKAYAAKSLRTRYAGHNDYIGFKRTVHDAQNPGDNAPPVPPASSWFPAEKGRSPNPAAARRRRMASTTDHTGNDDEDDDDIRMTAVVSSLKCPLTLQTFKEPYSNHVCKHTFEKAAILQFHRESAVAFVDPSQGVRRGRGVATGPKQLKCPTSGCDSMLELKDFYLDTLILRQVKRQQAAQAAADMEDDLLLGDADDDDIIVPGTQMSRPQDVDSGADDSFDGEGWYSIKNERLSRGPSQGHGHGAAANAPDSGDEDEDEDPELIDMDD